MKPTALLIMAAGIGSRFGGGIKQLDPMGLHNVTRRINVPAYLVIMVTSFICIYAIKRMDTV